MRKIIRDMGMAIAKADYAVDMTTYREDTPGARYVDIAQDAFEVIEPVLKQLRDALCSIPRTTEYTNMDKYWYDFNMWTAKKIAALSALDELYKREGSVNCPTCGAWVDTIWDHIAEDCGA